MSTYNEENNYMKAFFKKFIISLWAARYTVCVAWLFFFCIALAGKTPHTIFINFLISGAFSLGICSIFIILIITGIYPIIYHDKYR